MALVQRYEDLRIWQEARELARLVYSDFAHCKDWGFRDQIQRAVVSIMNNIAEGFQRFTAPTTRHLFDVAKGSAGEVQSMYYLAEDLHYVTPDVAQDRRDRASSIIRGIISFIHNRNTDPPKHLSTEVQPPAPKHQSIEPSKHADHT